jgi:hypothetical protein
MWAETSNRPHCVRESLLLADLETRRTMLLVASPGKLWRGPISAVELRPGLAETVSAGIPPQHQSYWLAVEIFRQTGEGWTSIARREATEVPHTFELDGRDVVLEIAYS